MDKRYYSNGKLLLTAEYVVLDGATALAIPTKYGQALKIHSSEKEGIEWTSRDEKGEVWFRDYFRSKDFEPSDSNNGVSKTLSKILMEARNLNPRFLAHAGGIKAETLIDFPRTWGLGTSSTLVNNIAQWAEVDAFVLLEKSFGGSGYDIAAAQHDFPILYDIKGGKPRVQGAILPWDFKSSLFFVHLNQKQDSKLGIAHYSNIAAPDVAIRKISGITEKLLKIQTLLEFEELLGLHERIISETLGLQTVKAERFPDFPGTIKSLGAWGGDFILAIGNNREREYFRKKGFKTIIPFEAMVL